MSVGEECYDHADGDCIVQYLTEKCPACVTEAEQVMGEMEKCVEGIGYMNSETTQGIQYRDKYPKEGSDE